MLKNLKEQVLSANLELPKQELVTFTWGNVSGIDRENGLFVIKPSGVEYEKLKTDDLIVLDLTGKQIEGTLNPSSDTPTHLELYNAFAELGSVVHTHSTWATIWSQSEMSLPVYGTTHSDYFYGEVPCTRNMTEPEVRDAYEANTGKVIIETFKQKGLDPTKMPGVLVANHGPFTFGKNAKDAVHNAVVLEEICKMGLFTRMLNPNISSINSFILDKHFLRKHGENAYYGQTKI